MRTPRPLPDAARAGVHASRDVDAFGISRSRLERGDVRRPHHGVWASADAPVALEDRAREYAPLLRPGQAFSHTTSLALWGAPVREDSPLHLSVLFPRTPPRGKNIRGHALQRLPIDERKGLPVTLPASAWAESGSVLRREEIVALGDFLVMNGVMLDELADAVAQRPGSPGAKKLRWALPCIRFGVRSRPESLLRLAIVEAGLPEPVIEHPIAVEGGILLHPDLAFVRERVVLEYEGDHHRTDRRQWALDLERRELLEAAGWRVVRVTAQDLFVTRDAFLRRLRALLASR